MTVVYVLVLRLSFDDGVKLGVFVISTTKGDNETKGVLEGGQCDGNRGYGEKFV